MSHEFAGYIRIIAAIALVFVMILTGFAHSRLLKKKIDLNRNRTSWSIIQYFSELVGTREAYVFVFLVFASIALANLVVLIR
jgi:hypothetical protein